MPAHQSVPAQQMPLLRTKFHIPPFRPDQISRPRLIERLDGGLDRKLTLVSAPAGFGKTTLLSEWVTSLRSATVQVAWLSLDESDNDPTRFLTYLVAAVQTIEPAVGTGALTVLRALQSQPPPAEAILTTLINELAALSDRMVLVLDDYHLLDSVKTDVAGPASAPIHDAVTFLLQHIPSHVNLVIATREDPLLPLARLRAQSQLTELRAADLRFTPSEAAQFLNQAMRLDLSALDIDALEARTEGWIAGLQLAALALQRQGREDTASLVQSFTGSHRYVLDYLVEEVLERQPESVQTFLLHTSILDRLCGPLCDAVQFGGVKLYGMGSRSDGTAPPQGAAGLDSQATLEMLERANLFIVPLDDERRWYRYHHLFSDLLRQRLHRSTASLVGDGPGYVDELHVRASAWYEENGFPIEAFHHAAAAHDIERAERLIEGEGLPLYFRGALVPILDWLESLPATVLDAHPSLWVTHAMTLLTAGRTTQVEEKLVAAERALSAGAEPAPRDADLDNETRDLIGRIANTRANLAVGHGQLETILAQSRRALEYLHPDNLAFRTAVAWKMGVAYALQGDRSAANQAYTEAVASSEASGNLYIQVLAMTGLGGLQLAGNQLYLAAETYQRVLQLVAGLPIVVDVHVYYCLARIYYEWNDLDAAQQHGQKSLQLAEPYKDQYDIHVACQVFLARLKLVQGDVTGADALLTEAEQTARRHDFVDQILKVVALRVRILLLRGDPAAAADLLLAHDLPISQARVALAQRDPERALAWLVALRQKMEEKGWQDERLRVLVLEAVALDAGGKQEQALDRLTDALALAEPGGMIRTFVDEGPPMARLLYVAATRGTRPDYTAKLLAAFPATKPDITQSDIAVRPAVGTDMVEPLSERELEVLHLIAEGLTNPEIAARLTLSLNTVKAHTRNIYGKLGVHTRVQAVVRARAFGVLSTT